MEAIWNAVRSKVSADKNRFMKGQYDLDLTYITDRIIAMAFPAGGLEGTYRNKVDDVAQMLKEHHSEHYVIYNLSERKYDYSKFENQVYEWCGFPDHHPPPLSKLFLIVRSMYSWLAADKKNVAIVHCLAGKGRTGTVIAAFLLYCGLFINADSALNFFANKRSTNNWGVTNPGQIRYVRYFGDILYKNVVPAPKTLRMSYVHMSHAPNFSGVGRSGCCPFVHVYEIGDEKKLIFSSERDNEELKTYSTNQPISFQIDCDVKGDILIEVYHVTSFYNTEYMLRVQFHTGMIDRAVLRFHRADVDIACQDKRYPHSFFLDVGFEPSKSSISSGKEEEVKWWENTPKGDGSICFFDQSRLALAKDIGNIEKSKFEKAGYLTKRGHKVKNWKRRWFLLRDPTLCYFKSPRDTIPAGIIILDDIFTVVSEKNIYQDRSVNSDKPNQFWFEIITKKTNYLICADSEQDMRDWVEAIEFVISENEKNRISRRQSEDTDKSNFFDQTWNSLTLEDAFGKSPPQKGLMSSARAFYVKDDSEVDKAKLPSLSDNDSMNSIGSSSLKEDDFEVVTSSKSWKSSSETKGFLMKPSTSIGDFVVLRDSSSLDA